MSIGEVVRAWADNRVFSDGHWHFDRADPSLRSLHYVQSWPLIPPQQGGGEAAVLSSFVTLAIKAFPSLCR